MHFPSIRERGVCSTIQVYPELMAEYVAFRLYLPRKTAHPKGVSGSNPALCDSRVGGGKTDRAGPTYGTTVYQ